MLAVGDFTFQRKCLDFAHQLERKGATILFVSHNMFSIKSMCQRVIYLKRGQIVFDGPTDEGLKLYEKDSRLGTTSWFRPEPGSPKISITDVSLFGEDGTQKTLFEFGERMRVRVRFNAEQRIAEPNFLFSFTRCDQILCCNFSTFTDNFVLNEIDGEGEIELVTPPLNLVSETYTVSIVVRQKGFNKILHAQIGDTFHVKHPVLEATAFGVFHEPGKWQFKETQKNKAYL